MEKKIRITIEGGPGSGKTRAINALRDAGWTVSEEETVIPNEVVRVVATMPGLGRGITYKRRGGAMVVEK